MQLTLDGGERASVFAFSPFDGECPACHDPILVVEISGVDVVAELDEVLGEFPCPQCAQVAAKGHKRGVCHRCGGSERVGEPLPPFGVAVAESGSARYFTGRRRTGEAVHREHVCAVLVRVSA